MFVVCRATGPTVIVIAAIAAGGAGGCVTGFRGSNVQIDLPPETPVQAHVVGMPGPGEVPANSHFTIYAIQEGADQNRLFAMTTFEIHRLVDPTSPCFIDVVAPHPGLHVSQYASRIAEDTGITDIANPPPGATQQQLIEMATAVQRMMDVQWLAGVVAHAPLPLVSVNAITSPSTAAYPAVASSCTGPADQLPPPACTDDASNQRRLELCQAAWRADPDLFEGTDRVLTAPLSGVTHGMIDGLNPINGGKVGGAQFFVDNALDNIDAYAIYVQADGADPPGTQLYFGRPTMPTRGVSHVHLVSPTDPTVTAEMAVFADLGEDDVHF